MPVHVDVGTVDSGDAPVLRGWRRGVFTQQGVCNLGGQERAVGVEGGLIGGGCGADLACRVQKCPEAVIAELLAPAQVLADPVQLEHGFA